MSRRTRSLRHATASRSAMAALLVAQPLATAPLLAQAFNGTPSVAFGTPSIFNEGAGFTDITINSATSPRATINWTPTDTGIGGGPINFLPSGAVVTFSDTNDNPVPVQSTILNRIIAADPTRSIAFSGSVSSSANMAVWFYAPGGILINSGATFNVGSLLLTANDPVTGPGGDFITGGNQFSLSAATGSTAGVVISPGAQINALAPGSYVIAVAPRVEQRGTINVNGSAALVAAEAVDFTLNAGLFDVSVTQGTSAAGEVITHTGTTTGAAAGAGENQRIYLVAVPKNDAITMFIGGGSLGFDIAGAANVDGNTVVLSAGHNVSSQFPSDPFVSTPVNTTAASIQLGRGSFTSAVTARATTSARLDLQSTPGVGAFASFASDLSLRGGSEAVVSLSGLPSGYGATLNVGGNLRLTADGATQTLPGGPALVGGTASFLANADSFTTIASNLIIDTSVTAISSSAPDAVGGTASVQALGGRVTTGGGVLVFANGRGAAGGAQAPGTGTGGEAYIEATGDGRVTSAIGSFVSATGAGGDSSNGASGDGAGGRAFVRSNGATALLTFSGGIGIDASGSGGQSDGGLGGSGAGGEAFASALSGRILSNASLEVSADGVGGSPNSDGNFDFGSGGAGLGGSALVLAAPTGQIEVTTGGLSVSAGGFGGNARGIGETGGTGSGGTALLQSTGGTISVAGGSVRVFANAIGGDGSNGSTGGDATAGDAGIEAASSGSITLTADAPDSEIAVTARGFGGSGDETSGSGQGGTVTIAAATNSDITLTGDSFIGAEGVGGSSLEARGGGLSAGSGTGGSVSLTSAGDGTLLSIDASSTTNLLTISAAGTGGAHIGSDATARGGTGTGGQVQVLVSDSADLQLTSSLVVVSRAGFGGRNDVGRNGNGIGGSAALADGNIGTNGGTLTVTGELFADARGFGAGDVPNDGGLVGGGGTGGTMVIRNAGGGQSNFTTLRIDASGRAGPSQVPDFAGTADAGGGTARLEITTGTVTVTDSLTISASAEAGPAAGTGGAATGGTAELRTLGGGGQINVNGAELVLDARAFGGMSGNGSGGNATGGTARLDLVGGTVTTASVDNIISLTTATIAGNGTVNGGIARGGQTLLSAGNGSSLIAAGQLRLDAGVVGGSGDTGNGGAAIARTGLTAPAAQIITTTPGTVSSIAVTGAITVAADAAGGGSNSAALTATGGAATAGTINIRIEDGDLSADTLLATAAAGGGIGINGGAAIGGDVVMLANRGTVAVTGLVTANSDARGGNGALFGTGGGGRGGDGTSGSIIFIADGTATAPGSLTFGEALFSSAAFGGRGGDGNSDRETGGAGGNALASGSGTTAGNGIQFLARGTSATISLTVGEGQSSFNAGASGGNGGASANGADSGAGGSATGGFIRIGTTSGTAGAPVITSSASFDSLTLDASASGGRGGEVDSLAGPGVGGRGGNARGGDAAVVAEGSTLTVDSGTTINVSATGGAGGDSAYGNLLDAGGGNALGGSAAVLATPHAVSDNAVQVTLGTVQLNGLATGGQSAVQGGNATGGNLELRISQRSGGTAPTIGTMVVSNVVMDVETVAGNGNRYDFGGNGGNGIGGAALIGVGSTARLEVQGNVVQRGAVFGGDAGAGRTGAAGANGIDGTDGSFPTPPTAGGNGGAGGAGGAGGIGGSAVGATLGVALIDADAGGLITPGANNSIALSQTATAIAGDGGRGGAGGEGGRGGRGGNDFSFSGGVGANGGNGGRGGDGGVGGAGGSATGGTITNGTLFAPAGGGTGSITLASVDARARAVGGNGGDSGNVGAGGFRGTLGVGTAGYGVDGLTGAAGNESLSGVGGDATGGVIDFVIGSQVTIDAAGQFALTADARGGEYGDATFATADVSTATGGTVNLRVDGGSLTAGFLFLSANGSGEPALFAPAGIGRGGSISLAAARGGTITLSDGLVVQASGTGGGWSFDEGGFSGDTFFAGDGFGGSITLSSDATGGNAATAIRITNPDAQVNIDAGGFGGIGSFTGGAGTGGTVNIVARDLDGVGGGAIEIAGGLTVSAAGFGGGQPTFFDNQFGGNASGGTVDIRISGADSQLTGTSIFVDAAAIAGDAAAGSTGAGLGTGGGITIAIENEGRLQAGGGNANNALELRADGGGRQPAGLCRLCRPRWQRPGRQRRPDARFGRHYRSDRRAGGVGRRHRRRRDS